jgi:alanine-glyoxylate transaminase/serine-glyoxylate transaminase/serine-pyruvate transaminase
MTEQQITDLNPPSRTLLGPGPSNVHPRVTRALTAPVVGYLDPAWFQVMDETAALLRQVYGTNNRVTFPLSGTGSSGMEGLLFNILEPGDKILIGVNGFFGNRLLEMGRSPSCRPRPRPASFSSSRILASTSAIATPC